MPVSVIVCEDEWQQFLLSFIKQHPDWRDILTRTQLIELCSHLFVNRTPVCETDSTN